MKIFNFIISMILWFLTLAPLQAWLFGTAFATLIISSLELVDALSQENISHTLYWLSNMLVVLWAIITPWITVFAPRSQADEFRRSVREYAKSISQTLLESLRSFGGKVYVFSGMSRMVRSISKLFRWMPFVKSTPNDKSGRKRKEKETTEEVQGGERAPGQEIPTENNA